MESTQKPSRVTYGIAMAIALGVTLASCRLPYLQNTRLRISNSSTIPVRNLTVIFPLDELQFGDIPARSTTEYQRVPNGVYRYAAYRFEVNGQIFNQLINDWFAEEPMEGDAFTYVILFDPSRYPYEMIERVSVILDD